jgi:hypothetical protein
MRRNNKLIITVILAVTTLAASIGGAVLATSNDDNTCSTIEPEELTDIDSAACINEIDGTIEDTGCGSKYFPSE